MADQDRGAVAGDATTLEDRNAADTTVAGRPVGAARDQRFARLAGFARATWYPVRAALPAWLLAHAIVLAALAAVWRLNDGRLPHTGDAPTSLGLFVWDSGWYQALAAHGYHSFGPEAVRFFPLLPLLTRVLATVTGLPAGVVLLAVCWLAALGYGAALFTLTRKVTGDEGVARRAAWLAQLVPGANVLVLGYTEALAGLLAVLFFWALRDGRWINVIPVGLASGLVRPTGVLLVLPAAVTLVASSGPGWLGRPLGGRLIRARRPDRPEGRRDEPDRPEGRPGRPARRLARIGLPLVATASPVLGVGLYLARSAAVHGDPLLPYTTQTSQGLRGGLVVNALPYLVRTDRLGPPWPLALSLAVAAVALLVVCARRLPAAWTVWAAAGVATAMTASGLHSLPRYLSGLFPLLVAAALVTRAPRAWTATLGACLVGFTYLAFITFTRHYVP
ncbi:MAG TPA: hypothetical protein VF054_18705 [Micromonosporaceae bacterium]